MQNNILALSNPNGVFTFASTSKFLANQPTNFKAGIASTLTPRNLRQILIGGYVQDDWHLRPNLTLNLGLRYEMSTVPTEVAGKLSALRQITDATPHLGKPYFYNPTYKNFEPWIGFAYDPFSDPIENAERKASRFDDQADEPTNLLEAPPPHIAAWNSDQTQRVATHPGTRKARRPAYVQQRISQTVSAKSRRGLLA